MFSVKIVDGLVIHHNVDRQVRVSDERNVDLVVSMDTLQNECKINRVVSMDTLQNERNVNFVVSMDTLRKLGCPHGYTTK